MTGTVTSSPVVRARALTARVRWDGTGMSVSLWEAGMVGVGGGLSAARQMGDLGGRSAYVVVAHPGRVAAVQQGDLRPPLVSGDLGGVPVGLAERPQGRMGHPCDDPATRA